MLLSDYWKTPTFNKNKNKMGGVLIFVLDAYLRLEKVSLS